MLKARIAQIIPQNVLNKVLLTFPFLYHTGFINYESYLTENRGVEDLLKQLKHISNVGGDIVECGSARCGTSIIIAKFLRENGIHKKVFSLDLFGEGLDPGELEEERKKGLTEASDKAFTYNSYEYILKKIHKLGFSGIITPMKGFFQDTLPLINSKFCLSFIDCDLSRSIEYCAEAIWPLTTPNGVMLFDDYGFENFKGVKPTVDAFVSKHKNEIEYHGLENRLYMLRKKN